MPFNTSEYDAVVYDQDGVFLDLAVDWDTVTDEIIDAYTGQIDRIS